jgi:hypothetical protein
MASNREAGKGIVVGLPRAHSLLKQTRLLDGM